MNMWKWEAEGQAKGVVAIIHSAYEYHLWYKPLIDQLRLHGYHIVMGDLPGHGDIKRRDHVHNESFQDYEIFVTQTLKVAMTHDLPVFVIGQGLGATLAIQSVRKKDIECAGVILLSPWLHLDNTPSKLSGALASMSKIVGNMRLTHDITLEQLTNNAAAYAHLNNEQTFNTQITVSWYRELQQLMRNMTSDTLRMPNKPTLLMTGGNDSITNITMSKKWLLQRNFSEFQYKEWPNCYHNLHMDMEQKEVLHYILDFIENVLRSLGYIVE